MMTDPRRPSPSLTPSPRTLRRAALALLLTIGAAASSLATPTAETEMGMLFYSPAERAAIERARSGSGAVVEEAAPSALQLSGLVRRGGGKSTAWINNRPWPEGPLNVARHAATVGAGGVSVDGRPLRVGETLDLTTGQRSDVVAAEAVRQRQSK